MKVSVKDTVNTSAETVWKDIKSFDTQMIGAPCEVEGSGVGALRTITMPDSGDKIVERLEALDETLKSLSYSVVSGPPNPFDNYLATIQVQETGENQCEITWSTTFDPVGISEADATMALEGAYTGFLGAIKKHYGG
ncbi:MAG: SRPBCC family protein [Desulfobacterales bacterium]|jgi:hypothetical protein|nr:SRPBCC family protein [Desulfobacteraceae bacterium]MBT7087324.1 SRPBCC family protein [Desulfobacterales bacterium]MBT7698454.1 SRPBCC family protein [Desulfobacterales bacterium]